jgi:hypothetical protein
LILAFGAPRSPTTTTTNDENERTTRAFISSEQRLEPDDLSFRLDVVALGRLCRQHGLASSVGWLGANMVVVVGLGGGVRLRVFAVFVQQAERWWVGPDVSGAQVLLALLGER